MTFEELFKNKIYLGASQGFLAPKKSLDFLQENLISGETLLLVTPAKGFGSNGVLAITNQRIIFAEKSMGSKKLVDMGLRKITSVASTSGAISGTLINGEGLNQMEFSDIVFHKEMMNKIKELQASFEAPAVQPAQQSSGNNALAGLEKLADLKAKGIITEEEFAAKKKAILGL